MSVNALNNSIKIKQQPVRKGRGIGSGKGKTAGRGHKGQRARSGGSRSLQKTVTGQTSVFAQRPKRGFNSHMIKPFVVKLDAVVEILQKVNLANGVFSIDLFEKALTKGQKVKIILSKGDCDGKIVSGKKIKKDDFLYTKSVEKFFVDNGIVFV